MYKQEKFSKMSINLSINLMLYTRNNQKGKDHAVHATKAHMEEQK